VPWQYLAAIHLVETRMGRISGVSSGGAIGPMQFEPATWARYGSGDINSNRDSILAAARLLVANGAPSDMHHALYNYNPSDGYVQGVEAYAHEMIANPRAFYAFYHYEVLYKSTRGTLLLPIGYPTARPILVPAA
jgi:membrane-bound lytic murein transglycosylase B